MYFTFITEHSKQQGASALLTFITGFYIRREKYNLYLYYVSSKNWELETLCWGRATGVMWDTWYFPPFPAHPARTWTVPGSSRFLLAEFHDSLHDWCFENAKRLISTCTTSLSWSTSVSIMSEWWVHNLHLLMIWVSFSSKPGYNFLAAVSAVFNFTNEPCPVSNPQTVGDFAKNDWMKSFSFARRFSTISEVTYTCSSVRLKSVKFPGRCSRPHFCTCSVVGRCPLWCQKRKPLNETWFSEWWPIFFVWLNLPPYGYLYYFQCMPRNPPL